MIKEYNDYYSLIIFEGEYLNGQKHGKGKEYYDNGKLEFEGEYLNGKRQGKGKEYYNSEITSENIFGNSDYSDEYGQLILKENIYMIEDGKAKDIIN